MSRSVSSNHTPVLKNAIVRPQGSKTKDNDATSQTIQPRNVTSNVRERVANPWQHNFFYMPSELPQALAEPARYHSITITDDHSEGSDIKRRKLMAVASEKSLFVPPNGPKMSPENEFKDGDTDLSISASSKEGGKGDFGQDAVDVFASPMFNVNEVIADSFSIQDWDKSYPDEVIRTTYTYPPYKASENLKKKGSAVSFGMRPENSFIPQNPYSPAATVPSFSEAYSRQSRAGHHEQADEATDEIQTLRDRISDLESQLQKSTGQQKQNPSRLKVLYRLQDDGSSGSPNIDTSFEDEPEIIKDKGDTAYLRCRTRVNNMDLFLMSQPDISLVVFRTYPKIIHLDSTESRHRSQAIDHLRLPAPVAESIFPVEEHLKQSLKMILKRKPEFKQIYHSYLATDELEAPYLFIYHSRSDLENIRSLLSLEATKQLGLLLGYVEHTLGAEYRAADDLLEKGQTAPKYIQYLIKPGEVVVEKQEKSHLGFIADTWPSSMQESDPASLDRQAPITISRRFNDIEGEMHAAGERKDQTSILELPDDLQPRQSRMKYTWTLTGKTLEFDGRFSWRSTKLTVEMSAVSAYEPSAIADMKIFPLRHAPAKIADMLQRRGSTFWKCRTKNLISYQPGHDEEFSGTTDDRYMIDMRTFRTLHPNNITSRERTGSDLGLDVMKEDERYQYLLPPLIKGYNLRRKVWNDLFVDRISDVKWNREAFHSLVIEDKAKHLIEALIVSQLEEEKSTDLISGKGNGLILLFHGGPGTGKTLTAEGVAEIAKKPLYRVTCGDVGTKAEDVEKYLDSVLHLGRIWDCVVLLDEADVFLEQRSLEDLARNALVSVFLRVLEYYEGILILTSNRVGTFDEAFISRIQLALHYPELGPRQRHQIWQTFIDRLEALDEDVDFADLRENLNVLKQEKLNGRQIRNVITTARQYAKWEKKTLTFEHLKVVIEISGRFGTYLHDLRGFSENELAKDGGIR